MRGSRRHTRLLSLAGCGLLVAVALFMATALTTDTPARAGGQSLSGLGSELGQNQAIESNLSADVASLNQEISTINHQISLVRSREAAVQTTLDQDRARLATTRAKLGTQETKLARARTVLGRARLILANQLVSSYEQPQQSLVSVVLSSDGFSQLLDKLQDLKSAETAQQRTITFTTRVRNAATADANALKRITGREALETSAATTEAKALAGMNSLLSSRQTSLSDVESARATALADARAKGAKLQSAIATIKAQQAAAARAAAAEAARQSAADSVSPAGSTSATPSGGWAIPEAIVMCESGGQNLPPNSAGASGYYQIIPATWAGEGGTGPAAYLAPKSEQDAIAARLWNNGAGASNWVCAAIVGIS
jgi:septal ring factor EnvC (AmiA/AmiB activator)